ncbi:hypothetical protein K504DRAFT_517307 [Pleomassaria siparia CBS 279.74]|uniref:ABM domain-containing protein n=1 Tax=Pleomassaria siparia CBS 279.74 TaxID=1314801 RepID=A0A6G1KKG3_9PLEO|nr:hypothetical protein K504DRAFT_517307 [Pleomassaria siparia CBS 279.74]
MGSYAEEQRIAEDMTIFEHWFPSAGKTEKLLEAFKAVLDYVVQNADNIPCFYLLKEKIEEGTGTIIVATRFATKTVHDDYLKSAARTSLQNLCRQDSLLRAPPLAQALRTAAGFSFRPPGPQSFPGIHAAMAKIQYAPGTRSHGIEHWKSVAASVDETEKEGTYTYWFLTDPEDEDVLFSLERYKSEEYLWNVHVPSAAIQDNIAKQKGIRIGLVLRGFESVEENT